jgi:hypothetical protein
MSWELLREFDITLDGEVMKGVRAFDTESGWVRLLVLNEKGQAQITLDGKDVQEEIRTGDVRLQNKPGSTPSGDDMNDL